MPPSSDVYTAIDPSRHCVFMTCYSLLEAALQGTDHIVQKKKQVE